MSIVQRWATSLADRMYPEQSSAALTAAGWDVEQLPDGRRRVSLALVSRYAAARRARIARSEGDTLDAMSAGRDRAASMAGVST